MDNTNLEYLEILAEKELELLDTKEELAETQQQFIGALLDLKKIYEIIIPIAAFDPAALPDSLYEWLGEKQD